MPGATPSGGYPAQPAGTGVGQENRTPLLIAIAVVAAVLVILLVLLLTRDSGNGDGGDGAEGSSNEENTEQAGYTEAVRSDFIDGCTGQNLTESECTCVFDAIETSIPYSEFQELEQQVEETGEVPEEIGSLVGDCQGS